MKIAFNPSTVAALITPPNNKDITFDLRGRNIFARGVKFCGTDTNTWRDIKINNVSIGSNTLDLRNGSNTTLTNTNGVVTINSTWRPVVDNLTSNSTTSSLSAKQGKVLKSLIDGKSDSGHNHDDRYLKLTGGTMASNALITFADSGSWGTDKGPQGARGGLYWTGQSDYAKLYAEETVGDNLDLVIQFGDDNSNGLSIRNKANTQTSYISAGGVITTGTFKGNLDWSYITNKPSSYTPSAHTHAWNSLTHSSTTENQAILTNGKANGWKLYTLNISRWDNAANNAHSHSNKSVLDGITSALVNNWNIAYTFVNTITGTDTDKVINKWDEIVNFLAGITEDNKLNTLLNSKLSVYELANNTNVGAIKNNGIYYSTTDASSGTLTNSPFNTGFALINMTSYDGGDDLRRSRLAFNAYGEIKVSNDRDYANTAETWYNVLTSKNSGINGSTIKLNGTSITVYSSSTADGRYVKKSGDTMTGALNFKNGTWNLVGDDSYMGDCNVSGHFGIKAANTTYPGIAFFNNANAHLGNLTAYNGNIKYGAYSLRFLDNGNTSVGASTWTNPFSGYNSNAVADGQAICVWGQSSSLSNLAADSGDMSLWLKRVNAKAATLNMVLDGEYYANGHLRLAHISEIPTSLKNPYALTISLNGTSQGPYDGSAAKNINITPGSIGAAVSNHSHDYLVVNAADDKSFNSAYHNFLVLYAAGGNGITGRPPGVEAFGLIKLRAAYGYSGQILLANGGSLYIRSSEDALMTNTLAWKTILDSSNYSGILDSRYYTESEVNNLLSRKLDRVNLTTGSWNPRGYNLAADYSYNGGDLSISESGGKIHVSVDGYFWLNEGQYRVLDTSDVAGLKNNLTVHLYLSNTDTTWWPLIWGGSSHNNTSDSTGTVYKSYDKLSWLTSSLTLYATKLKTTNLDTLTALFHPDNDSTLKIYSGRTLDAVSDGHIGLQTSIDNTDGLTHVYPTLWGSRCVLALQPRGGSVYIGNMPNGGNSRKLNVNGDIGLFNVGSIRDLTIGGGIYWNPYVESATDGSDAASITLVRLGVAGGTTLVLSLMNDANDTILFQTNGSARLYHNSYPILTTLNTYVSNSKGYINGTEITLVNNANKWLTARTFTIGNTSKSVDGSSNVSWSLSEIGAASSSHTHTYLRGHRLGYRHLDAGPKSSWSDSRLYIGYNGFDDDDGVTNSIGFYRSTGTGTYTRTLWAEINSNGLWANSRFGVNGQNTGYHFYVNGTSLLNNTVRIQCNTPNLFIRNTVDTSYSIIRLGTNSNENASYIFQNGPSRTDDGGANTMTIRNNVGYLRLDNSTYVTGLLTVSSGSTHKGIKIGNNYINAINGELIIQNNTAIRFGDDSWDYNVWAGLKYNSSNKTIYLGLADKTIFSANSALSGGSLRFPGISNVYATTFNGSLSGNASTATKLQTARTIWGQSFNGTANIDNTLRIRQTTGNYCEGIRIQNGDNTWATIILGATGDSGTNANAWSIHRKADNNFAISRNSSDGLNGLVMTSVGMGLGTTAPTQRLDVHGNIRATGQIIREGSSLAWVNGRKGALLRETTSTYYHTLWSLKTTNGSWDFGEYNSSGWNNIPVLSYITDTNFNSGNNTTTYQIKFPLDSGTIALTKNIPTSLPANGGNADTVDGYHASGLWRSDGATWNPGANVSLTASGNNQEWSFDIRRNGYTGCYWHVWDSALSTLLKVNADNGKVYAPYNFVGNLEGNASTATALTTNAGNSINPIYFSGGKPVACTMSTGRGNGIVRSFSRGTYTSANQYFGNGTIVTIDPKGTGCISANDTILSLGDLAIRNTQLLVAYDRDGVYYRRITDGLSYGDWKRLAFTTDNVASATNAYHLRINSANTWSTWYWAGLSGLPSWLWGSNDGTNMYVWNPSNFRVAYASSSGNADTVDGYHYNNFTYKKYIGYNRNGPYNMKIFSKDISSLTWGASYLIFDIFSSGYNSNRVYFGRYEVSLGHWNNTDKNPTVYSRWIFKTNSAYDCVHVIKDLSNYTVDVYIENNLWDCSMGLSIIAINGFNMVSSNSWVNLPSASGNVLIVSTTYLSFMGNSSSATKVIVNLNTANDTNYPLVWSNLNNSNTVTENLLFKSWSDLYYNPKNKRLTVGGSIYAAHFYESSDKTLKKNIKSILSSTNIPKIREFDWKDTGEHSYGFIALELEELGYGCLVSEANGKKTVNYTATLALTVAKLLNLINIQNKKISNLTKELKALKYGRKKNS